MRSGNPALNENTFDQMRDSVGVGGATMTIRGTATKTLILLGLCIGTASFTWTQVFEQQNLQAAMPWMIGGLVGGLIASLVVIFKPTTAPVVAPIYALAQGLFLGGVSALFEATQYNGIVIQAVAATFGTMFALLMAYQTGLIRATENFKLGVFAATGGIAVVYLVSMVGRMFFSSPIPYIHESGVIGIGFSLFVVVIAALNLVLDFDFIEDASNRGAPRYMEWYGAFGLMVTLVWLYLEILRLLAKLNSRD